jgi:hypothetical protein
MERVAPPPPPRSEAASKEVAEMSGIERSELLKNIGNQKLKHGLYKEVSPSSRKSGKRGLCLRARVFFFFTVTGDCPDM